MLYTNFSPGKNCFLIIVSNTLQSSLERSKKLTQHSSVQILWQFGNQHLYYVIGFLLSHTVFVLPHWHKKNFNSLICNCIRYGYAYASAIEDLSRKTEVNPTDLPYCNKRNKLKSLFLGIYKYL